MSEKRGDVGARLNIRSHPLPSAENNWGASKTLASASAGEGLTYSDPAPVPPWPTIMREMTAALKQTGETQERKFLIIAFDVVLTLRIESLP